MTSKFVDEKNDLKEKTVLPSKIGKLSVSTFYTNIVLIANTIILITVNQTFTLQINRLL